MDPESRTRLTRLYQRSLERHGPTARGQRWSGEESQRERFRLLAQIVSSKGGLRRRPLNPRSLRASGSRCARSQLLVPARFSVADVGCGVGDFLPFLRDQGWRGGMYEGFDIVPEMVAAARRKQRGRKGRFTVRDVLAEGFPRRYDYVVASGTFNLRVEGHDRFFRLMVEAMYAAARRGVAFNVLQPVPRETEREKAYDVFYRNSYYTVPPAEVLTICYEFCPKVEIVESERLPLETTVLLRRTA